MGVYRVVYVTVKSLMAIRKWLYGCDVASHPRFYLFVFYLFFIHIFTYFFRIYIKMRSSYLISKYFLTR